MASYTRNGAAGALATAWINVEINGDDPLSTSSSLIVLTNSDGTETRISGAGFTFSGGAPTGGNITSIARTSNGGGTVYESVTGLSLSLVTLFSFTNNNQIFAFIFGGADTFNGHAGNDFFVGGPGGDVFTGGDGADTVSYQNATAAVIADLATPANNSGDAAGDTYSSIEVLVGSAFNDSLRGGAGTQTLVGGNGSDFLRGRAGADVLNGGAGSDWADYIGSTNNLVVDLMTPASNTFEAQGDTFISIENIRGGDVADTLRGDNENNILRGGLGADVLDGREGNDTADYSGSTIGLTIDLGNPSNNTGEAAGDSYISIERLRGTAFDDQIFGNDLGNQLEGREGADLLDGRGGFDYARYAAASVGVTASLANQSVNTGDALGDTYASIEGIIGSSHNDHLIGNSENNFLAGADGADVIDGGGGSDTADYLWGSDVDSAAGITADLLTPANNTGHASGDTYISIENLRGTAFADQLFGNNSDNTIDGWDGADAINGRGGIDFVSYANAPTGVTASLANSAINTGHAAGDTYVSIEGLIGSEFDDILIGDGSDNIFRLGLGDDSVDGGGGSDTVRFNQLSTAASWTRTSTGWTVTSAGGTDTLAGIERLEFIDRTVALEGSVEGDITGDGTSDIVWFRASNRGVGAFEMDTGSAVWSNIGTAGAGWTVAGLGDVTGDGTSDIIWYNTTSRAVGAFEMDTGSAAWSGIGNAGAGWAVVDVGDITGDGTADIVWYNATSRAVGMFEMDTGTRVWTGIGTAGAGWAVAGVGDITGDGTDDIIWFNAATRAVGAFEMDTGTRVWSGISTAGTGWQVVGVGDFTGDGAEDILWHNTSTNAVGMHVMDSGTASWRAIGNSGASWTFADTGDYNGDGTTDILWQHVTSNAVGMYQMDNGSPTWVAIGTGGSGWDVV